MSTLRLFNHSFLFVLELIKLKLISLLDPICSIDSLRYLGGDILLLEGEDQVIKA